DARQSGDSRHSGLVQSHDVDVSLRVSPRAIFLVPPPMPLCNPAQLKPLLAAGNRVLGLDVGTKTIGMALSDTTHIIATPLETIRRTRFRDDVQRMLETIARHQVGGIVVG